MSQHDDGLELVGLNHVKVVTPDPDGVLAMLKAVTGIERANKVPQRSGVPDPVDCTREPDHMTMEEVLTRRGGDGRGGYMFGEREHTRRLQIYSGTSPALWGVALFCDDLEAAHESCVALGLRATEVGQVWSPNEHANVSFFYVECGGILFEFMRTEAE